MERALEIGAGGGPLTVASIEAIHREIAVVPPLDKIAGQIREEPSWIGGVDPERAPNTSARRRSRCAACSRTSVDS